MIKQKYVYEAKLVDIHDGDTITVEIDLGFEIKFKTKIRFYGINTPELKILDENKKLIDNLEGTKSLEVLKTLINIDDLIIIETIKDKKEKFGRYLANIYTFKENKQIFINQYLLENNLAVKMKY